MSQVTHRVKLISIRSLANHIEITGICSPEGINHVIAIPEDSYYDIGEEFWINREVDITWKTNENGRLDISYDLI